MSRAMPAMCPTSASVIPEGLQVPGEAVSCEPTLAVPVATGASLFVSGTSLKWMNPLGQPSPVRVIRAQEKSPPQLSCEMMISVGLMTFST